MIQLSVDAKVGVISACSDGSSTLQFTITGLLSYAPRWLRSSTCIEEEGRGGETRLANACFRSNIVAVTPACEVLMLSGS